MKNTLLLLAFLLVGFASFSQQPAFTDSTIVYQFMSPTDSIPESKSVNEYDYTESITLSLGYNWDSNTNDWVASNKEEYTYDSNGNRTLSLGYNWDSNTNDWVASNKEEYTYDSNGNRTLFVGYNWDSSTNDWVASNKQKYTYDSNENRTLFALYKWDSNTNDWVGQFKSEYTYDSNENMTLWLQYIWDLNANDWIELSKYEYIYDSNGKETLSLGYMWDSNTNDWVAFRKAEVTYDSNGNDTLLTSYNWDSNTNDWVASNKEEYTYDSNGNRTSLGYNWDSNTNDWVASRKIEVTFDSNGYTSLFADYEWDSNTNDWVGHYKYETTSDSYGNTTLVLGYDWDSNTNEFFLTSKYFFYRSGYQFIENSSLCSVDSLLWQGKYLNSEGTYFANYTSITGRDSIYEINLTILPEPVLFSISGETSVTVNQIVIYAVPANPEVVYSWIVENGNIISNPVNNSIEIQWDSTGVGVIYALAGNQNGCMSDTSKLEVNILTTGINDPLNDEITFYPNPVRNVLNIKTTLEYSEIDILDLTGRNVQTTSKQQIIDVSFLNSGVYIVRIKDREGVVIKTERIMKE